MEMADHFLAMRAPCVYFSPPNGFLQDYFGKYEAISSLVLMFKFMFRGCSYINNLVFVPGIK